LSRVLDFKDHRRSLDDNRYVYAVVSRRARGVSIGVNLNPDKVCNFDCPYCQVDRTTPGGEARIDVQALRGEVEQLLDEVAGGQLFERPPFDTTAPALRRVADIAFSGDGEPTTPPEFPDAARAVREARDARAPAIPLRLITNATRFDRPRVRSALAAFDELWCKLDAGSEGYFQLVDGTRFPFARLLRNLLDVARERPIVIQAMFLAWQGQAPPEAEVEAWLGCLRALRAEGGAIDHVQVYTVARRPADPRATPLAAERLESIAARARGEGFRAEAFV
jgi:wyosine [tRNA(Phe)-imidazoG37] synthetase (radical SAM superfamily)